VTLELTPLERACVALVASENWPAVRLDGLRVTKRENTGVGRYVHLADGEQQQLKDGVYATRQHAIEMMGVRLGLDFAVAVINSRIDHLELVTAGADGWDGIEREWKVI
jgi:hypothetical protein